MESNSGVGVWGKIYFLLFQIKSALNSSDKSEHIIHVDNVFGFIVPWSDMEDSDSQYKNHKSYV